MAKKWYIMVSSFKNLRLPLNQWKPLVFVCIFIVRSLSCSFSQDFKFGTPKIYNHSKESYHAGPQNYSSIYQNGSVYFANNGGLLSFDGITWKTFPTSGNTIMRSIAITSDKSIYVGAQGELGFFQVNGPGSMQYVNLLESFKPQIKNIGEVWHILPDENSIAFSSNEDIFLQENGKTTHFSKKAYINSVAKVDESIWYHATGNPVFQIKDGIESKIPGSEIFSNKQIVKIIKNQKNGLVYLMSLKNGIFIYDKGAFSIWENNAHAFLKEKRISSALYEPKHGLIIGTYLGGLIIINDEGQTTLLLNKKNGLQNNTINTLTYTPNDVLWTGTNNGIDEIDFSSLSRQFFPDNELEGAVYDVEMWQNKYYFSTSNGLYSIPTKDYYNPLSDLTFNLVEGTEGQTWGTDIIAGQLYCAHHEGPLKIDQKAQSIPGAEGAWKFMALDEQTLALGNYKGISLYNIVANGDLNFIRKVEGFEESARIMVYDKFKNLWVSHPYKNVYKINFSEDYKSESIKVYDHDDGFKVNNRNYVFNIDQTCYLTNETGIYRYAEKEDLFQKATSIDEHFESWDHVRRLIQNDDDIWCISDRHSTCLTTVANGLDTKILRNDLQNLNTDATYIGGFEELFPIGNQTLFISSQDGAMEYDLKAPKTDSLEVAIKSIDLPLQKDSLVYTSIFDKDEPIELKANENALRISFRTKYPNSNNYYEYSYRLSSIDENWSNWSSQTTKEYNNLPSGNHQFEVKVRNVSLLESPVKSMEFSIKSPWYKSTLALLIYLFLLIALIAALLLIPRRKYKETTAQLEKEKKQTEEDLEAIKKEKLMNEIQFKNYELANNTLQLLQKNQTLNTLREKFDDLNESVKNPGVRKELNKILNIFRNDLRLDDDWEKFSIHFDQVHQDFIKKLKAKYPNLSANDHKLCAYLKMNLTTKEIAPLLNISVRGVEISRYRLRKKLQLERAINLNQFFNTNW